MPIIIKVFSDFTDSSTAASNFINVNNLLQEKDYNQKYKFTSDENYTHAIIINTCKPKLTINKDKVIGLAFEPRCFLNINKTFLEYAEKHIGQYLIGDNRELPENFINHFSFMWHKPFIKEIPIKTKLMSIMISTKLNNPGHKYRHILTKAILKSNLPIDIWGNGCQYYKNYNDSRIKGSFKDIEPFYQYKFHIAIENSKSFDYFSEKIMDPLVLSCEPIYLGASNINKYFPETIKIVGERKYDMELLENITKNPDKFYLPKNLDYVEEKLHINNLINNYMNDN